MPPQTSNSLKRINVLRLVLGLVVAVFVLRLFYLQIIKYDYYTSMADSEQLKKLTLKATRGIIYTDDKSGVKPIVLNQAIYTVFADPKVVKDAGAVVQAVKDIAGGNAVSNISDLLAKTSTRYQVIATGLTRDQANKLKEKNLYGIGFQEGTKRVYPEGSLASQVLGFVDYSGTGRYGVEGYMNDQLKGQDGLLQSVTDVSDVPLTIGNKNIKKAAQNGKNLVLTLDRNVQAAAESSLESETKSINADNTSIVVMNAKTGQVVAMANYPTYDPSDYSKVSNISVFNNNVTSLAYEPASTMKTLAMATGIDLGAIKPTDTYDNTDSIKVDDRTITNATKGHTGTLTFQQVLNYSLNTGSVTVFERIGDGKYITKSARDKIYDYYHNKFRIGVKTGIQLSGESSGLVVSPDEAEGNAVRYSNMSFGQGVYPTMLQMAAAYGSIVNNGKYCTPTILAGEVSDDGKYTAYDIKPSDQIISPATANTVMDMTKTTMKSYKSATIKPGYDVGGKSGTAETIENGKYTQSTTVASFIGHVGDKNQMYSIMVRVSAGGQNLMGALDAMPIFDNVVNWMIDYYNIEPGE